MDAACPPEALCIRENDITAKSKMLKFVHLFKYTSDDRFRVTWIQFVCTSFMLTMPANYLIFLLRIFTHGGLFVYGLIILFTFFCALPLNFFYTFVGMYSGNSYLKMWRIAPIFAGVGATIWLMPFADAIDNFYMANLAMNYTLTSLQAIVPWHNCDFTMVDTERETECRDFNPLGTYTVECCNVSSEACAKIFPFPALVYYEHYGGNVKTFLPRLINYAVFAALTLLNVRRYMGFVTILTVVFGIILIPIMYVSIYYGQFYTMPKEFSVVPVNIYTNILYTYMFSLYREVPAGFAGLGTLTDPTEISITNALVAVYCVKILLIGLIFVWQIVGLLILKKIYKIEDITCLLVDAHEVYYASIPDLMTKWHVPQIWLIFWFLLLYFWSMISTVHMMTFNVNAVVDLMPHLKPCRNVMCILLILLLALLDVLFDRDVPDAWTTANRFVCCVIFVAVPITIVLYSVKRLAVDFYFLYEQRLSSGWINLIKISVVSNMFLAIACLMYFAKSGKGGLPLLIFALMLLPIIGGICWRLFTVLFKRRKPITHVMRGSVSYGHRDPMANEERRLFKIEKKTKFSASALRCRHRCIVEIKDEHPEVQRVELQRQMLARVYVEVQGTKLARH